MKIAFGCDHAAFHIQDKVVEYLEKRGHQVSNFSCDNAQGCDYPDSAVSVAKLVSGGICEKGILICGTGAGMAIVANKYPNVRAAVCWNESVAVLVAEHNNANILCLPARFASSEDLIRWIDMWLKTPFSLNERHHRRVNKISQIEKETMK